MKTVFVHVTVYCTHLCYVCCAFACVFCKRLWMLVCVVCLRTYSMCVVCVCKHVRTRLCIVNIIPKFILCRKVSKPILLYSICACVRRNSNIRAYVYLLYCAMLYWWVLDCPHTNRTLKHFKPQSNLMLNIIYNHVHSTVCSCSLIFNGS